ncbi:kinase-like domain-containing protein [Phellopilus nigrolimitatus]|nr:kinase-like domain-containing protein [Phellopilus nigrolimitatus]
MLDTIEDKQIPCLINRRIDKGRYLLTNRLGAGGYSIVYRATDLRSPGQHSVAVKCLLHDTSARRLKVDREVALHTRASPLSGVASMLRTVDEGGLFFIVLEYCPDGDLFSAISETKIYLGHDHLIKSVFLQLLDTVHALHLMGVYHRDLKPENILCAGSGMKLLIADFGLATESEHSETCLAGSYTSRIKAYSSRAADIWALGVILVNLICSRTPWKIAMLTDPSFRRYTANRGWLRHILPLSAPAFKFVDRIFANHGNNVSLADLREQFLKIDSFCMSSEELACASKSARLIASEWMPDTPIDDIVPEDLQSMMSIDDVTEAQLFEDKVVSNSDSVSDLTIGAETRLPSLTSLMSVDADVPGFAKQLHDELLSASSSSLTHSSSAAESDFPITPETKPAQPVEVVPDLPADQGLGEKWVLSPPKMHSSDHKALGGIEANNALDTLVL